MNKEYKEYLSSPKWKKRRESLFTSRGKKCEKCSTTKYLHIHHLTYIRIYNELDSDLQILCKVCHKKAHKIIEKEKPSKMNGNRLADRIGFGYSKPNAAKTITSQEYRLNKLRARKAKKRKHHD